MTYSTQPQGLFSLLKNCFTAYPKVLKSIWYLVLITLLMSLISNFLVGWNHYVGLSVGVLSLLAVVFIFAIILHVADTALSGAKPDLRASMANARRYYLRFLGGYLVLFGLFLIVYAIDFGFLSLTELPALEKLTPLFYTIVVIFSMMVFFLTYFMEPIIVLEHQSVFKSLDRSVKWVWQYKWPINAVLVIIYVLLFAIILADYKFVPAHNTLVVGVCTVLFQLIIYPLLTSTVLVLLNDMKVRQRLSQK
jgi:hypothetical protein